MRRRYVVLAPRVCAASEFAGLEQSDGLHDFMLAAVQRFRGEIYFREGAIGPKEMTVDGRHVHADDPLSWFMLAMHDEGEICACVKYTPTEGINVGRVGGWAARPGEGIDVILAMYALMGLLGGCSGRAQATTRNRASDILLRIGLTQTRRAYWSNGYECVMVPLEFDSNKPNPKYKARIDRLAEELKTSAVVAPLASPSYHARRSDRVPEKKD